MWLQDCIQHVKGPLGLAEHVSTSLWASFSEKRPEENTSQTKAVKLRAAFRRYSLGSLCQGSELQGNVRPVLGAVSHHISVKTQLQRSLDGQDLGSTVPVQALRLSLTQCPRLL